MRRILFNSSTRSDLRAITAIILSPRRLMNKHTINRIKTSAFIALISLLASASGFAQKEEKPTVEALVASHLSSIGTAEARAAVQSITAIGTTKATFHGRGGGAAEGIS